MPKLGRPASPSRSNFKQVTMAPDRLKSRNVRRPSNQKEVSKKDLLNKLAGYKEESIVDTSGKTKNVMGKDEFLKLLTFQLQNQDPMNPMEQEKFTAELAQFSQLEQLTNLNKKFDNVNKNAAVKDRFFAASFLGKQIVTNGSSLKVEKEGQDNDIYFSLGKNAKKVVAKIIDNKGGMVGVIETENMYKGNQKLAWDGVALDGYGVKPGEYNVRVYAWDDMNQPVEVETNAVGIVESVTFDSNGEAVFVVDNKRVNLRDVKSFHIAQKDLSMHNNSKAKKQAYQMPKKQVLNSYTEQSKGIYD